MTCYQALKLLDGPWEYHEFGRAERIELIKHCLACATCNAYLKSLPPPNPNDPVLAQAIEAFEMDWSSGEYSGCAAPFKDVKS